MEVGNLFCACHVYYYVTLSDNRLCAECLVGELLSGPAIDIYGGTGRSVYGCVQHLLQHGHLLMTTHEFVKLPDRSTAFLFGASLPRTPTVSQTQTSSRSRPQGLRRNGIHPREKHDAYCQVSLRWSRRPRLRRAALACVYYELGQHRFFIWAMKRA